jgi:hypothetical protein
MPPYRFVVFLAVSMVVFVGILQWVLRRRETPLWRTPFLSIAFIVVVLGMCIAKFGANIGLPWPVYYGVPALMTLLLPPVAFHMRRHEVIWYLVLAFASSPAIHTFFSLFVGWPEYMPFWHIPSLREC